jgi:hypothetical protein
MIVARLGKHRLAIPNTECVLEKEYEMYHESLRVKKKRKSKMEREGKKETPRPTS